MKIINKKKWIVNLLIMGIVTTFLFVGCGSSENINHATKDFADGTTEMGSNGFGEEFSKSLQSEEHLDKAADNSISNAVDIGRKIIKTYNVRLETKKFEEANSRIVAKTLEVGGYIQNSHVSGIKISGRYEDEQRNSSYNLRIPKDESNTFINELGNIGNVQYKDENANEITDQYFDSEAHLKALKIQEERLLELLKQSGELSDILEIERELSNVRYQIESFTGTLRKWDNLIEYSTITIDVIEVAELTVESPTDFIHQIKQGFINSLKSLYNLAKYVIIVLVISLPYLFVAVVIILIVLKVRKRFIVKKGNKSNNENDE